MPRQAPSGRILASTIRRTRCTARIARKRRRRRSPFASRRPRSLGSTDIGAGWHAQISSLHGGVRRYFSHCFSCHSHIRAGQAGFRRGTHRAGLGTHPLRAARASRLPQAHAEGRRPAQPFERCCLCRDALGLVSPEGLCRHVRQAVEVAGTDRIGHGVDVMYEREPEKLLKDMAAKQVLVEINLTSNEDVLGVSGKSHPFPIYCKFGVPVALSTDDEGIERIDLTNEYVRAAESTISATPTSSSSCATALNTAFCPA